MANALDQHVGAYQGNSLYDFDNEILLNWYPQRIVQLAGQGRSLLELGLGHGHSTMVFSRHFADHVVLEGSPAVIGHFRSQHPDARARVVETYFETFDTDQRFDVIVMGFVLEHVDDPQALLRRYREFLAPAGRIFVAVPNAEALNRRLGHLAGVLADLTELSEHDHRLGHRRFYSAPSLRAEVAQAGFSVDRLEGIYLKPFTTRQIVSLQLERKYIDALCRVGQDYPELCCGLLAEVSAR
jgi:SAM-dependent methyltransferase